ncbi:MAG: biosynthetic-type acetolactate synthase large subunit [Chthoniobacteraceae bacterium]|nr:biosynthetic-type acetolactate synthase large subunit [Chthoniobacteraceae bacterium]
MKFNGAQILCKLLERQGVTTLSGIPGGAILPLYDALYESPLRHVLARHEQGAGFIAQGMARVTGKAAVCLGTSGPGATNLLTAIADAKLDSVPLVAITGQVARSLLRTDAFQEVDTFGLTLPITKHSFMVMQTEELFDVIPRAFEIAESGRPGPVVVDVPKDVFLGECEVTDWPEPGRPAPAPAVSQEALARMAALLAASERPVLYVGGGVIGADAGGLALELAERLGAPAASTLMGLGAIPCDHPLSLGMLGMHGAPCTNYILDEADLLVVLGARFDDRATGHAARFCPEARIIHIEIDPCEIDKIKPADVSVAGDVGAVLRQLLPLVPPRERPAWRQRAAELKASHPLAVPRRERGLHPLAFCQALGAFLTPETIVTTDVGQHQMWMAQGYPVRRPRTFLTSGGLGTMGFGLPAAIGAALAAPGRRVVCVSGDGSLLMNVQELATLAEWNLDVTVILLNNNRLGMVRQQQELFYGKRYSASVFERQPDFAALARAFGIRACDLGEAADPAAMLKEALAQPGPCLVNLPIAPEENVFPIVPPGAANTDMIGMKAC